MSKNNPPKNIQKDLNSVQIAETSQAFDNTNFLPRSSPNLKQSNP